jgi:hypothetical protein
MRGFARDGFGGRSDRCYGDGFGDDHSEIRATVAGRRSLAERIPGSSDCAASRPDGDADSRLDLHNTEESAAAVGTSADDGVVARSRNHADVLRRRKFERWWRNCSDRHSGRNLYDHRVREQHGRFDYVDSWHEAYLGRSMTDLWCVRD